MWTFLLAVVLLLITPGPGVLSTAGVGAAYGRAAGHRYVAGLCLGTNLVALAVVSGVAALVLAAPALRGALVLASAGYLLWLAARIALAGAAVGFAAADSAPGFRDGVLLQAINPKAYVVNATLFGGFPFEGTGALAETLLKLVLVNAVWIPVHLGWLAAGIALERLQLPPRRRRAVNVAMALALVGVVALALLGGGLGGGAGAASGTETGTGAGNAAGDA